MSYVVLLLILFAFIVLSYVVFKKDILSPTLLTCIVFFISVFSAWVGKLTWNNVDSLSIKTISYIILGILCFGIGELFARKVLLNKVKSKEYKYEYIKTGKLKFIIVVLFIIATLIITYIELHRVCMNYGVDSWDISKLLKTYRYQTNLFNDSLRTTGVDINFCVKQAQKISIIIAFFYSFVFINNLFTNTERRINLKKQNLLNLIPVILGFITSLTVGGGRAFAMRILLAVVLAFILFYRFTNVDNVKRMNRKILKIGAMMVVLCLLIFYGLQIVVGRNSKTSFIEYTSFYFGTSIPSFELYMQNGIKDSKYGGLTFNQFFLTLDKLNIVKYSSSGSSDWVDFRSKNGKILQSNVYTNVMLYHNDFGILGVISLEFIFGFAFSVVYIYVSKKKSRLSIILFLYYFYMIIDQTRSDAFYKIISSTTISVIVFSTLIYIFIFKNINLKKYLDKECNG